MDAKWSDNFEQRLKEHAGKLGIDLDDTEGVLLYQRARYLIQEEYLLAEHQPNQAGPSTL